MYSKKISKNIYEKREKKIILAAVTKVRGGNPDLTKMLDIEKNLYEEELFEYGGRFQSDFRNIFIKDYDFMSYIKEHANDKEYLKEPMLITRLLSIKTYQ